MNQLDLKLEYLGYSRGVEKLNIGKGYDQFYQVISKIKEKDLESLTTITLEEVIKDTILFYEKYFSIHDIRFTTLDDANSLMQGVLSGNIETLQAYKKYYELSREITPFDIPIKLVEGHSMVGRVEKPLMIIPKENVPSDIGIMIPFSEIKLGNELTKLSSSTYIHEIAHTQQESNPGYAESYLNKEVISIFLEKLSALENDPTGKTLKVSERRRFMHIATLISELKLDGKILKLGEEEKMDNIMYIHSTLLAEKMFDMYLQERKQKNKDKYIYDIQDVFDGKQTVEDMISRRNITVNQGKDLSLIKRHIYYI